ncbi:MAG: hypothetical protein J6P67_04130 [Bacteroidaceae bacterium]|nr:hypothetical protein [Bacteroidaceae bacterium]
MRKLFFTKPRIEKSLVLSGYHCMKSAGVKREIFSVAPTGVVPAADDSP